ncbi:MAG: MFS transporter [Rhodobacteraceae bacterium]|nr:MFS transporter [Paracoccaceae bacterium]
MIMVDYEIAQQDVPAFLDLMSERRRIRIRDGAQQWTILRDLENPDIWTETYHVPTWVEYIRHHERRTQSDARITDRLLALHKRTSPVRVHRMIGARRYRAMTRCGEVRSRLDSPPIGGCTTRSWRRASPDLPIGPRMTGRVESRHPAGPVLSAPLLDVFEV